MWLRVVISKYSVHYNDHSGYSYIDGQSSEEYYFDKKVANALENDGFLIEMWDELEIPLEWGDCEFLPPDKCMRLKTWLETHLQKEVDPIISAVYKVMFDYVGKAILYDTGISFDF